MAVTPEQEAIRELAVSLSYVRPRNDLKQIVDGKASTPRDPPVAFTGAVQPSDPRRLRHLPEGQDARDVRVIWTETELIVNDEVTDAGELFVVQTVEFWREGAFYEATMLRRSGELS